jgi:hypothetical protein
MGTLKDNRAGEETSALAFAWVWSPGDTQACLYGILFLWTLRALEVWVWGQCGTSLEGQGSRDSGLGRGHKGPVRPTCIGTIGAQPVLILSLPKCTSFIQYVMQIGEIGSCLLTFWDNLLVPHIYVGLYPWGVKQTKDCLSREEGLIGCHEMLVTKYPPPLRNIP